VIWLNFTLSEKYPGEGFQTSSLQEYLEIFIQDWIWNYFFSYILEKSGTKWDKVVDYPICFSIFVIEQV
jgi:hypothetical protein